MQRWQKIGLVRVPGQGRKYAADCTIHYKGATFLAGSSAQLPEYSESGEGMRDQRPYGHGPHYSRPLVQGEGTCRVLTTRE